MSYAMFMPLIQVIDKNPCDKLSKMPHSPAPKLIPTEIEILKLIAVANPETDERDLILTLLYSMARVDEILRLKWEDVNFEKATLTKWTKKRAGGAYESVIITMNIELCQIMKKRWDNRINQIWVFYNEDTKDRYVRRLKLMKGLCKKAGITQGNRMKLFCYKAECICHTLYGAINKARGMRYEYYRNYKKAVYYRTF